MSASSAEQPQPPQPQQPQQPQQSHLSSLVNTSLPMKLAPRLEPQTMSALLSNGQPRPSTSSMRACFSSLASLSTSGGSSRVAVKPPTAAEFPELCTATPSPTATAWTGKSFAALAKGWAQADEEAKEAAKKAAEEQAREDADLRQLQAKHQKELTALKTLHRQSRPVSFGYDDSDED